MTTIYLDNNATTRPLPAVVEAVTHALGDGFGNPNSVHGVGEQARRLVDDARSDVAALLSCRPTEVIFTSCATESINTALRSAFLSARKSKPRFLITAVEHEAVFDVVADLKSRGAEVEVIPVDSFGALDLDALETALKKPTTMLSLMYANNETGCILDVESAVAMAKDAGAQVHLDAVQAVGKIPLEVGDLGVDFLSLSGHKFHAPKGVGVLFARRGARFRSFVVGAGQETGRRGGTENVPGIVGLGAAARHMGAGIEERCLHLQKLSDLLEEGLLAMDGVRLNGPRKGRMPGTVNVSFQGIEGAAIVVTAARSGVCLSAGSACSAAQYGGSHVLEAMDVPFEYLHGALRVSCCETTTAEEVARALEVVESSVRYLRRMDPTAR